MFEHPLKNAYIGEVYEYSYDFRNKSTSQITTDGWSYSAGGTPSFSSYGARGSAMRITRDLSLTNAKKLTLTAYGTLAGTAQLSLNVAKTVTSSTREGVSGITVATSNNTYSMNIYGTYTNYNGITAGTYTWEGEIDFENKTWTLSATGKTTQTGTLTDTEVANIRNNTTKLFVYADGTSTNYGIATINIQIEK